MPPSRAGRRACWAVAAAASVAMWFGPVALVLRHRAGPPEWAWLLLCPPAGLACEWAWSKAR